MFDLAAITEEIYKFYASDNTIIVLLPEGELQTLVCNVAEATKVQCDLAEDAIDLIALPSFLAIIDPRIIPVEEWETLCDAYHEMQAEDMKFLLVAPSPHQSRLPEFNYVKPPLADLDEAYFKFLILRTRAAAARRTGISQRPEKRIIRMMYMLRQLEVAPPLRLQDVAQEFEASVRTIQRDLQVLLMVGHPIIGPDEKGGYWLPKNYKVYFTYYPDESKPSDKKKSNVRSDNDT